MHAVRYYLCQSHCKNVGDMRIVTQLSPSHHAAVPDFRFPCTVGLTDHFTGGNLQEVSELEN